MDEVLEGIVVIIGLILTVIPALLYFYYLMSHVSKKTKFDYHLELVKDKKGTKGVIIAYLERILFGLCIVSLGIVFSEYFANETFLIIFVMSFISYIIVKYFDEKNEK